MSHEGRRIKAKALIVRLVFLILRSDCSIPVGAGWIVEPDGRLVQCPEEWTSPWRLA